MGIQPALVLFVLQTGLWDVYQSAPAIKIFRNQDTIMPFKKSGTSGIFAAYIQNNLCQFRHNSGKTLGQLLRSTKGHCTK